MVSTWRNNDTTAADDDCSPAGQMWMLINKAEVYAIPKFTGLHHHVLQAAYPFSQLRLTCCSYHVIGAAIFLFSHVHGRQKFCFVRSFVADRPLLTEVRSGGGGWVDDEIEHHHKLVWTSAWTVGSIARASELTISTIIWRALRSKCAAGTSSASACRYTLRRVVARDRRDRASDRERVGAQAAVVERLAMSLTPDTIMRTALQTSNCTNSPLLPPLPS
jgi:hypothetical protein